jgi:choline dehydrogenase-like flavoprotein
MASTAKAEDVGEFDYVIVGAGSAGCALAARLSEDEHATVCVLEAGGNDNHPLISTPIGFAFWPENTPTNWSFDTAPQKHLNNRTCFQPRGRGLGGSSSINAMIYIRGTARDYDRWAALGADGWSWRDVLPYFRRAEGNERGASDLHGADGPLSVSDLRFKNPICDLFLDACDELQLPRSDDFNGPRQEGMGYYQVTQRDGRRCSAARAYLHPANERPNVGVFMNAHSKRVIIENGRATGVVFAQGRDEKFVLARREVILSAGAFQSPQLLMLSGVGPAAHLREHGVEPLVDLPGVGQNLQDHLDYTLIYKTKSKDAVGIAPNFLLGLPGAIMRFRKSGDGVLTSNLAEAGGFLKTEPSLDEPDVQFHFVPGIVDDHGRKKHIGGGYSCHVCVLRPKARGSVSLASADPMAPPVIDPNFLGSDDDRDRLLRGVKLMKRIMDAPAFDAIRGEQLYLPENADDNAIIADMRARSDTIYHPVGTCKMGTDEMAVVDPHLRVRGVQSLRVADASIMPTLIGGNTNAPSIMIGEKAADIIRGRV